MKFKVLRSEEVEYFLSLIKSGSSELIKKGLQGISYDLENGRLLAPKAKLKIAGHLGGLDRHQDIKVRRWFYILLCHLKLRNIAPQTVELLTGIEADRENRVWAYSSLFAALPLNEAEEAVQRIGEDFWGTSLEFAALLFPKEPWLPRFTTKDVVKGLDTDQFWSQWLCLYHGHGIQVPKLDSSQYRITDILSELNLHQDPMVAEYSVWSLAWSQLSTSTFKVAGIHPHDLMAYSSGVRRWYYRLITKNNASVQENMDFLIASISQESDPVAREGLALGLKPYYFPRNYTEKMLEWYIKEENDLVKMALIEHFRRFAPVDGDYRALVFQEAGEDSSELVRYINVRAGFAENSFTHNKNMLTPGGIRLPDENPIDHAVDFAIITVRDDEYDAVLKRFPKTAFLPGPRRTYALNYLQLDDSRFYRIAMASPIEQGPGAAQQLANDIIEDLNPQWLIVIGIAGSVPDNEFTLGDVVVATRLHDFTVGAFLEGRSPQSIDQGGPMLKQVQDVVGQLRALGAEFKNWSNEASIGSTRPPVTLSPDNFYGNSKWKEKTTEALAFHFGEGIPSRQPAVTARSVVSSGYLIKDSRIFSRWLENARDVSIVEMELSGIYRAARQQYPILAVRGISDVVGFKRDPAWTAYACETAAAFAFAFLKTELIVNRVPPQV